MAYLIHAKNQIRNEKLNVTKGAARNDKKKKIENHGKNFFFHLGLIQVVAFRQWAGVR